MKRKRSWLKEGRGREEAWEIEGEVKRKMR